MLLILITNPIFCYIHTTSGSQPAPHKQRLPPQWSNQPR